MHERIYMDRRPKARAATASVALGNGRVSPTQPATRHMETDAGRIKLLDSIDLNEATLAAMTPDQAAEFARAYPGLRIREEVILYPLRFGIAKMIKKASKPTSFKTLRSLLLECIDGATGAPIVNADVVIVLNRKKGIGIKDLRTDSNGRLTVPLPAGATSIDAVICAPLSEHWPGEVSDVPVAASGTTQCRVVLERISDSHRDSLDGMVAPSKPADGKGVRVAIIDAGVAVAPSLNIVQGLNTTGEEAADDWGDNGSGHGTHVAGIVSRIAPAAQLYVYRVFEKDAEGASEFAISRAIRRAVEDNCDLINLSLGQDTEPISVSREVRRARALGAVCIAATGNDYMAAVNYPARSGAVVSVSAAGVLDSWPVGARTGVNVASNPKPVGDRFFAAFSNIGPEVDFIGPGVGIISFVGKEARGVMDGTSMACPAVTGLIARLLARRKTLLESDRDRQRSDDIIREANMLATPIDFGRDFEGAGLIDVP